MSLSYFNFWVRNTVLYLFFCVLGLVTVLVNPEHPIHQHGQTLRVIYEGGVIFLLAHIQVYFHNLLYQKYFSKRNWKYFFGTVLLFTSYFLITYFTPFHFAQNEGVMGIGISIFLIYLVGLGFYYIHKNLLERNLLFKNQLVNRDEEIRHLKAQLNPHFLFNALNNLYGTALTDPGETPEKILELSELLRYQIESSKKERVSLDDEIQFIRRYLSYEQNRNPKLTIELKMDISPEHVQLSPMLFMPFIENAIKYSSQAERPYFSIYLHVEKKKLTFKMRNNFSKSRRKFTGTNTGISNTKKRLELTYDHKHQLDIKETEDTYFVDLDISL